MVEMVEAAEILHQATGRSLLILDEIGRGTSTYDGLSIAWSMIEYLHNHPRLKPRTLFATHYHELVGLADMFPMVANYNVAVAEEGETVTFLHQIVPGGTRTVVMAFTSPNWPDYPGMLSIEPTRFLTISKPMLQPLRSSQAI